MLGLLDAPLLVLFSSFNLPHILREAKKFLCFSYRLLGRLVKVFKVIVCYLLENLSKILPKAVIQRLFENIFQTRLEHEKNTME